ncbi:AAA family ATPase [Arcanobacterium ihumii]|uniref:AAA family ATPase n=1 Tax=Arcanobacterium ihumii TaxID=2138162 RepID=UPI000F52747E|nr:AAA family ATPase [Arcanobacterium ihumii]
MIIRRLEFNAIGPFGGHHSIDFDQLTESGIFLLDGPTGSGKSSIIDAIVFALYGNVAGKDSSDERIRSSHAVASDESWVDVIFTVATGTYRVRRTPQWERPKKSGKGTTKVNQSATLWRLSESAVDEQSWELGEPLSTQAREVGIELSSILGLDKKQFLQTVVLPQGQFADFLKLKSSERAPLLETIFDTSDYRIFADELAKLATDSEREIKDAALVYRGALATWKEISDFDQSVLDTLSVLEDECLGSDVPSSNDCDQRLLNFINSTVLQFKEHARSDAREAKIAQDAEESARQAKTSAAESLHNIATFKELNKQLEALREEQELRNKDSKTLELHRAAQLVNQHIVDAHDEYQSFIELWNIASAKISTQSLTSLDPVIEEFLAQAEVGAPSVQGLNSLLLVSELESKNSQIGETIGFLRPMLEQEESIEHRRKALAKQEYDLGDLDKAIKELDAKKAKVPSTITALKADEDRVKKLAATVPSLEAKLETTRRKLGIAQKITEIVKLRETESNTLEAKIKVHNTAKEKFDVLTAQWISSTAANLALELEVGSPCPVCGSIDHPQVAEPSSTHTTRDQVDKAQALLVKAAKDVEATSQHLVALESQLKTLRIELGKASFESLEGTESNLVEQHIQASQASDEAIELSEKIHEAEQQLVASDAQIQEARAKFVQIQTSINHEKLTLENDVKAVQHARGKYSSVREYCGVLQNEQLAIQAELKFISDLTYRAESLNKAAAKLEKAVGASPFGSSQKAKEALLDKYNETTLTTRLREFERSLSEVKTKLSDPKFLDLPNEASIDIEALEGAYHASSQARQIKDAQAAQAERLAYDAQRLALPVASASQTWHRLAADNGPLVRIADIAQAGRGSHTRVPLSMWVLLKRFELVVERANEHLAQISGGRYELRRTNEGNRIQKTGLGLSIIDRDGSAEGDVERSTASLSGGETFFTSLSLALALAEVVQEENGGIRIDTLIIDEGFGTLSDDVRDAVMKTLASLTTHGRKVGIVSHVEELKQMIPNRISLSPAPSGGSTLTVTA